MILGLRELAKDLVDVVLLVSILGHRDGSLGDLSGLREGPLQDGTPGKEVLLVALLFMGGVLLLGFLFSLLGGLAGLLPLLFLFLLKLFSF